MKNIILLLMTFLFISTNTNAVNYTWTGNSNSSWTTNTNWSPNGVPGANDTININTTTNSLVLSTKQSIRRLVMNSDTLNLGGDTLEITGSAGFNGGFILNGICYPQTTGLLNFAGTTFGAEVKSKGQIKLNGSTFNSTACFEHTGGSAGTGSGGNTFNGNTTLKNAGTSTFRLAGSSNDTFNGDVSIINASPSGSAYMQLSYGAISYFNGNVEVSSTTVYGVSFSSTGTGASYLASGKMISVGSGGFTGTLLIQNFHQLGTTAQSLTLSGVLNIMNSYFEGALTSNAASLLLSGNSFHGACTFTKTGSTNDFSNGGNHFYGNLTLNNNATTAHTIRLANAGRDVYDGDVTLNTSNGNIQIAYSDTSEFKGDITINSSKVTFNNGSGYLLCSGTTAQEFGGSADYKFGKLIMNKTANGLTLQRAVTIDSVLTLANGIIYTDSIHLVTLKAGSTCNGASSLSYVEGPVQKIGNTAFVFPVGKSGTFRKFGITAPAVTTDNFRVEFINNFTGLSTNADSIADSIPGCDYWKMNQIAGSSSVRVSLYWDSLSCESQNYTAFRVGSYNDTLWNGDSTTTLSGNELGGYAFSGINYLGSGKFTISVFVPNNSGTVTINSNPPVTFNYNQSNPFPPLNICLGQTITFEFSQNVMNYLSGSPGGYGYYGITPPSGGPTVTQVFPSNSSITYPFNAPGTYTVVTKINNAPLTNSQVLNQPNVTFTINVQQPTPDIFLNSIIAPDPLIICDGESETICADQVYTTYEWSTSATTQCITVSTAGNYSLTVTDNLGCEGNTDIDVQVIPCCSLTVDLTAQPAAICNGASLIITATTMQGTAPYTFLWNTGATTGQISVSIAGTYSVIVTDGDGCTAQNSIVISASTNPVIPVITGSTTACVGTGLYLVSNPQTGCTYSWSFIPAFSTAGSVISFTTVSATSVNATFSNVNSNYLIQVTSTNVNGCTSSSTFSVNGCCDQENDLTIINGVSNTISTYSSFFKISGIFTVNSNVTWNGNDILMDNGAEIRVLPGFTLSLNGVYIHPCDRFWKSITVYQSANIVSNSSTLQGGQYAIDVSSGGGYSIINNCRLWDNYVGLRVQGAFSGGNARNITFTDIGLAPTNSVYNSIGDYINQSPPSGNTSTCNARPFAGVVLNFAGVNTVGTTLVNNRVSIRDAMFGIHSTNTFLRVVQTDIENCWNDPCQSFNPVNGSGIYATTGYSTGNIWVTDNGLGQNFRNNITNCFHGIRTNRLAPIVRENIFDNVVDGVRSTELPPHYLANRMEISNNNFKYGRSGVRVLNSPGAFRTDFNYNVFEDITTLGAFSGFRGAINVVGNRFAGCEFDGGGGNIIHLNLLRQGIYAAGTAITQVGENEIYLNSPSWQRGILLEGCDDILVMSNAIFGNINSLPFDRVGIDLRASGLINKNENDYLCNEVNYCSSDIRMEQNSTNMDFGFNIMRDGNTGLNLIGTIAGLQFDKFNKWCGSFNNEAILVDAGSNATFLIPPSLPPTPAGCNYNPFNNGGVNGAGSILINPTGTDVDPLCQNSNDGEAVMLTSWDYFIADSLENIELDQNYKNQLKRQLIQKLVYHPSLKESDSSMMAFWSSNIDADGMKLAVMDSAIRNIYSSASSTFDEATVYSQLVETNLRLIQILDSLISTGLSVNDSLDLFRIRDEYSIIIDSLFVLIDSLVNQGNLLLVVKADELIAALYDLDLTTEMDNAERDYQIFVLKYGPWTSTIITSEDSTMMVNLAHLCMKEYGPVVAWARKWIVEWFDEHLEDDELCNSSSRLSHSNELLTPDLIIALYPNPALDQVKIELNKWKEEYLGQLYVKMYTMQGQLINSFQLSGKLNTLVLENFLSGAYNVEMILNKEVVERKKLIIVK